MNRKVLKVDKDNPSYGKTKKNITGNVLYQQLLSFPDLIRESLNEVIPEIETPDKMCIFGMGESSIVGNIVSSYLAEKTNRLVSNYSNGLVPGWVDGNTTVIIISYSGDNSIQNKVYDEIKTRGCTIYCLTNGGLLLDKCKSDGVLVLKLPDGLTPRTALGYELGLLSLMIQKMKITNMKDSLSLMIDNIRDYRDSLIDNPLITNLIEEMAGNNISIYGSSDFLASFKRWKMSLNEDLDILSFYGELPEFNHNEIVGWSNHHQKDSNLIIVILRGDNKDEVLKTIVEKIIEVLEENGRHVIDILIPGENSLERNLCAIMLGDYLSQSLKKKRGVSND